jgi:hypothetical protein
MDILAVFISSIALILSGAAFYRSGTKPPEAPTAGTRGLGGGGR